MSDDNVVTSPLTIAGKQDGGIYRCIAENGAGRPARREVSITIMSKSVFPKFGIFGLLIINKLA